MKVYNRARFEHIVQQLENIQEDIREIHDSESSHFEKLTESERTEANGIIDKEEITELEDFSNAMEDMIDAMRDFLLDG